MQDKKSSDFLEAQYTLKCVTLSPSLWKNKDPVRPNLGVSYKTQPGRKVFGLRDNVGKYVAFCCVARAFDVPHDIVSLSALTSEEGKIYIPYTVWSHEKGAGRTIINEILKMIKTSNIGIDRVVTLSPPTAMAEKFHLRNGAKMIRKNIATVNFEYGLGDV